MMSDVQQQAERVSEQTQDASGSLNQITAAASDIRQMNEQIATAAEQRGDRDIG